MGSTKILTNSQISWPVADKTWDQPKHSPIPKFLVADKAQDSQPKLSPTPQFPAADKARDSQHKLSPTPKFPVADRAHDSQTKLQNFLWPTKPLSTNLGQSVGFSTKPKPNSQISCGRQTVKSSTKN